MPAADASAGGASVEDPSVRPAGRGRLCVGPDGQVWPCIFARWVPLGRVGEGRGLEQVLAEAQPQPGWVRPSIMDTGCREQLQCGECRIAAAALATMAQEMA